MGQVPTATTTAMFSNVPSGKILLIGEGRLATVLAQALAEHTTSFTRWSRRTFSTKPLPEIIREFQPTHVWLAISDRALREFAAEHAEAFKGCTVVHFAGSLPGFDGVFAAHPLTTFADGAIRDFEKIPFILDIDGPSFSDLMPGFKNPAHRLDPKQRAYYHALCAIAGNFTVLLWESVGARFENQLELPSEILENYRAQIFENLARAGVPGASKTSVLTGPLVRGDHATIAAHHHALLEKFEMPLLKIYDGFADLYTTERSSCENGS